MDTQNRFKTSPLNQLENDPKDFTFFQAVRLLELFFIKNSGPIAQSKNGFIGTGTSHFYEGLRLQHKISLSFPASEIKKLKTHSLKQGSLERTQPLIQASIMGLAGVSGPLPQHYTDLILEQGRLGDHTLKDFLSFFDHRLLSFFYRAWVKNKIFMGYEQSYQSKDKIDWPEVAIQSFHGNSILFSSRKQQSSTLKKVGVFYAGLLSQRPRSAAGLQQLLRHYLSLPVQIISFEGMWLHLTSDAWTSLKRSSGHNQLGCSALLGRKVWSQDNKFTIVIGPLGLKDFLRFLFDKVFLKSLKELLEYYVNNNLDYSLQLLLKAEDVPRCQIKSKSCYKLGQNSWIMSKPSLHDKSDTILKRSRLGCIEKQEN